MKILTQKKQLTEQMKLAYDNKRSIVYGMANIHTNTIFVNLAVMNKFSKLIDTITHECLHIATNTTNEYVIDTILKNEEV